MKKLVSRRDFLKLTGLMPLSVVAPKLVDSLSQDVQQAQQNVIVIVFDALSAYNLAFHGYQRETMPNLARLAEKAVVYHNHYAGSNFTTPGTASLLTGTLPWTHRAINLNGLVDSKYSNKNIFTAFQNYYCLAYTHNPIADTLLAQFEEGMNEYIPLQKFLLTSDGFLYSLFGKDIDTATVGWVRTIKRKEEGYAYSLFLPRMYEMLRERQTLNLKPRFPGGIPNLASDDYYLLENAVDQLGDRVLRVPQPFMGYFHFMPPHRPYLPPKEFYDRFERDGYSQVEKPIDKLFNENYDARALLKARGKYDEFILYADREFGKFIKKLDESGLLANTWVILTSDHGEMFERGIRGHSTSVLYEPVIRVPLVIFEPGRRTRTDIYENTSVVDVLPTLLYVTGQTNATWVEGQVLPPFQSSYSDQGKNIYAVRAKKNGQYDPLTVATMALIKEQYKLMYFIGYEELDGEERIELYDLKNDPEELNNLFSVKREITAELFNELKQKLAKVNEPYL